MRWIGRIIIKMFILLIVVNGLFYGSALLNPANILKTIEPQGFDEKIEHLYYRARLQYLEVLKWQVNKIETTRK